MKAHVALWASVLPLAFSAPVLVSGGDSFKGDPQVTTGPQPCTTIFSFITSNRARHTFRGCDNMLLEGYAYLADRWFSLPSFSPSTKERENPQRKCKSPILPDHLPTPALREELDALPGSTSTSASASTALPAPIAVSLPSSKSQIFAYADRMRLEDIIASRDFSVFLDWLSARPIMAWTLIVAVLIIVFFVSAVIVEIAVALRNIISPPDTKKQQPEAGEIYLFGPEKRLAAAMVVDDREENPLAYTE
ncbi:hypothetical protein H112_07011 [Trichophyton rubrum D6]|uniref:Uncharacterized protein n=4 Tax=Trichophyton TaxID=5550 RepID=A0A178F0M1_TRIRU|nr:uncharacterized protein TERG_02356 [Trichophyton rubrum CBS 118892]EZF11949.1 hypothetical protein H100_07034 [Trichophyton rubrum MR850]EZF38810.1 hypothetical protein H102_06997 [Trichophyton rubrum CBS 100081]EZF49442.1 hypothetical protein H103_07019 [Trichophyton rubrum CBS 288.86]EZF60109.1 hypothetical protein H104_06974 [Trichophyton rubrum CBS 289.86]EZF70572.1 hypothetical protein H105_07032 [Trichophyton soudanense CBS 452.61]EZF81453.1 hypothetical protein H110_07015 [Trichophy